MKFLSLAAPGPPPPAADGLLNDIGTIDDDDRHDIHRTY